MCAIICRSIIPMDIAIGILCFGDKKYFDYTNVLIQKLCEYDIVHYILTDQDDLIQISDKTFVVDYNRPIKSYHDKIMLATHILKLHDVCVLLDADIIINDYDFFHLYD